MTGQLTDAEVDKMDEMTVMIADQIINIVSAVDPHFDKDGGRHIDARTAIASCGRVISSLLARMPLEMHQEYINTIKGILDQQYADRTVEVPPEDVN